jgi:hypothetical protein
MNTQYGNMSTHSRASSHHLQRSQSLQVPPNLNSPARSSGGVTPLSQQVRPPKLEQHSSTFTAQPQHPTSGSRQDVGMGNTSTGMDGINGPIPVNMQNYNPNNQNFAWDTPEGGWPSTIIGRPHNQTSYKNAYSSTGFDMLGVLVGSTLDKGTMQRLTACVDACRDTAKPRNRHRSSRLVLRIRGL